MPGPQPKDASIRARRNKTSTAATLTLKHSVRAPKLPDRDEGWLPQTVAWWKDIWASPMAPEFIKSDQHGLHTLAALVDDFWRADSAGARKDLAGEIRLQRQCFGLTPIDRRRLQWEIERTDEAVDKGERRRAATPKAPAAGADPRSVLRAV